MQSPTDINTATLYTSSMYSCYHLLKIELTKVNNPDQLAQLIQTIYDLKTRLSSHSLAKLAVAIMFSEKYTREQLIEWTQRYSFMALALVKALNNDHCLDKSFKREILINSIVNYDKSLAKPEVIGMSHDYFDNNYLYALVLLTRSEFTFGYTKYYLEIAYTTNCIEFHEYLVEKLANNLSSQALLKYFSDLFNKINSDLITRHKINLSFLVIDKFIEQLLSYPELKEYLHGLDIVIPKVGFLFSSLRTTIRKPSNVQTKYQSKIDLIKDHWKRI